MALLKKVASFGTPHEDLEIMYVLIIRSVLDQSATVWHRSLSEENIKDLKDLAELELKDLETKRKNLCSDFVKNKKK